MKEARLFGSTRRRITMVFAAILMGAGLVAVTAVPAHASQGQCPFYLTTTSKVCYWEHVNYGGSFNWQIVNLYQCVNVSGVMNDKTSSLINSTDGFLIAYSEANCATPWWSVSALYERSAYIPVISGTMNDKISSWKACPQRSWC